MFTFIHTSPGLQFEFTAECLGVGPTCGGQPLEAQCASNYDPSARAFFFCILEGPGGPSAALASSGSIATAKAILDPVTNDELGKATSVEGFLCWVRRLEVIRFLGENLRTPRDAPADFDQIGVFSSKGLLFSRAKLFLSS